MVVAKVRRRGRIVDPMTIRGSAIRAVQIPGTGPMKVGVPVFLWIPRPKCISLLFSLSHLGLTHLRFHHHRPHPRQRTPWNGTANRVRHGD